MKPVTSGRTVDQTLIEPVGTAVYNALQAQLDRSFSNGLQVKASYTLSKAIDNVDNELGSLLFYDAANFARNRSLAGFDRTHNFRLAWVAELPFGAGKHWVHDGVAGKVLGGWQVSGINAVVTALAAQGVRFERYSGLEQDAQGIWSAPSGARVAWFQDPDGNVLSVAEYPAA